MTAVEFLSEPVPGRTFSERRAWEITRALVIAEAVAGACFLLAIILQANGHPKGCAIFLTMALVGGAMAGGMYGWQYWFEIKPFRDLEHRWQLVLIRAGLTGAGLDGSGDDRVRYWRGDREHFHGVLVRPKQSGRKQAEDFAAKADVIAGEFGMPHCETYRLAGGWVSLRLCEKPVRLPDPEPVPEPEPEPEPEPLLRGQPAGRPGPASWTRYFEGLPIGAQYDVSYGGGVLVSGPNAMPPRVFQLRLLGSHVLLGGETGAGKSSWPQSIINALLPAVVHQAAVLVAIDPKGVELALGRGVFRHYASEPDGIAALLEDMVERMTERKQRMAGKTRELRPTSKEPVYVIFIDELFPLTKGDPDPKRRARVVAAMNTLLTQGRALGFVVVGAVQDPRKETVDNRDLFNIRVALRMPAGSVDVVLGPKCREEGAAAHQLTEKWRGAGYLSYQGRYVLARATWTSDEAILRMAAEFQDGELVAGTFDEWWCPLDETRRVQRVPVMPSTPAPIGAPRHAVSMLPPPTHYPYPVAQ